MRGAAVLACTAATCEMRGAATIQRTFCSSGWFVCCVYILIYIINICSCFLESKKTVQSFQRMNDSGSWSLQRILLADAGSADSGAHRPLGCSFEYCCFLSIVSGPTKPKNHLQRFHDSISTLHLSTFSLAFQVDDAFFTLSTSHKHLQLKGCPHSHVHSRENILLC